MSAPNNLYSSYSNAPEKSEMMNSGFQVSEYDIKFEAYMSSKMGKKSETNRDNYYINGLCEKSFKFSDIEKPYDYDVTHCGVFAVGSGITTDRASKLLMRFLDEKKDILTASKNVHELKKRLAEVVEYCNNELISEAETEGETFEASLAIAVYLKEYFVYAVCGEASIVHIKNNHAKRLISRCGNLGIMNNIKPLIGTCEYSENDKVIFLSKGAYADSSPEEVCYSAAGERSTKSIIKNIIDYVSYENQQDSTCLAVSAVPPKGIYTRTLVIAGVCALFTLLNILILILKG